MSASDRPLSKATDTAVALVEWAENLQTLQPLSGPASASVQSGWCNWMLIQGEKVIFPFLF